jgi:RecB family endonuclease NucS
MNAFELVQAEFRQAALQLQRRFQKELADFFVTFQEEIVAANRVEGRQVSPVVQDAARRLEESQNMRIQKLQQEYMSRVALLAHEERRSSVGVDVN